jgi:hypothetical protein
MKIAVGIAGVVVLILVIWGVKSLFSDGRSKTSASNSVASTLAAPEQNVTLTALAPVSVQVSVKNPDGTRGEILLPNTPLARGEQRVVPWQSALYITATMWENLQVEVNGKRIPITLKGSDRAQLQAPTSSP